LDPTIRKEKAIEGRTVIRRGLSELAWRVEQQRGTSKLSVF